MTTTAHKGLSSFHLKLIAIITMAIDHVGAVIFPDAFIGSVAYLRAIGRLAFPIFCFLIVEGYFHTRNVKKYLIRLFMFALISELPFDLAFNYTGNLLMMQNVFFTLFLGLLNIALMEMSAEHWGRGSSTASMVQLFLVLGFGVIAHYTKVDYAEVGIAYMAVFYLLRGQKLALLGVFTVLNLLFYGFTNLQLFSILAIPIVNCYNGQLGPKLKYFFYAFYPLHLLAIWGIYIWMNGYMPNPFFYF